MKAKVFHSCIFSFLSHVIKYSFRMQLDVSLLKQFSQPTENKTYVKECIKVEQGYLRQAFRCK